MVSSAGGNEERGNLRAATLRRIVTGRDAQGRSIVVSDGPAVRQVQLDSAPGVCLAELWRTEATHALECAGVDPTVAQTSFVPGPGETLFRVFEEPSGDVDALPDGTSLDRFFAEAAERIPGLAETLERDVLGMHTTESVDYIVVLRGNGALELDDDVRVPIGPGDCIVQNGTRHRWHNLGQEPLVAIAVMVGSRRQR